MKYWVLIYDWQCYSYCQGSSSQPLQVNSRHTNTALTNQVTCHWCVRLGVSVCLMFIKPLRRGLRKKKSSVNLWRKVDFPQEKGKSIAFSSSVIHFELMYCVPCPQSPSKTSLEEISALLCCFSSLFATFFQPMPLPLKLVKFLPHISFLPVIVFLPTPSLPLCLYLSYIFLSFFVSLYIAPLNYIKFPIPFCLTLTPSTFCFLLSILLQSYLISGGVFSRFSLDELFSWSCISPEAFILQQQDTDSWVK